MPPFSASSDLARRATRTLAAAAWSSPQRRRPLFVSPSSSAPARAGILVSAARVSRMAESRADDPIVQYIIIRRDLRGEKGWPLGSLVAQACHASVAVVASALGASDDATREYVHETNVDTMRKVVLETKDEEALRALSAALDAASITHKLWIEQPENVATWCVSDTSTWHLACGAAEAFGESLIRVFVCDELRCIARSIALKPYVKSEVSQHLRKLKLAR